jgi:glycine dehydrogenase subunit 1
MALYATIYMSVMGRQGLREAAEQSYAKAHWLCDELVKTGHFSLTFDQPFFNEFCLNFDGDVDALQAECIDNGYLAGVKTGDHTLMLAVTEKRTDAELADFVDIISNFTEKEEENA